MTQLASTSYLPGPSLSRNWLSWANAGAAAISNKAIMVRISGSYATSMLIRCTTLLW